MGVSRQSAATAQYCQTCTRNGELSLSFHHKLSEISDDSDADDADVDDADCRWWFWWYIVMLILTRVWRIYLNIWIFKFIGHEYLFVHSFESIFLWRIYSDIHLCQICLYDYIQTFVCECVIYSDNCSCFHECHTLTWNVRPSNWITRAGRDERLKVWTLIFHLGGKKNEFTKKTIIPPAPPSPGP